jgi:hypothetical protein
VFSPLTHITTADQFADKLSELDSVGHCFEMQQIHDKRARWTHEPLTFTFSPLSNLLNPFLYPNFASGIQSGCSKISPQ